MDKVLIFDATLYGGGQSPGAYLNIEEKLEIAWELQKLDVDVLQAGFPIASPSDFKAVQRIAEEVSDCTVCALARAREEDIDVAAAALKKAAHPRIQVGLGVSDSYVNGKLKITHDEALNIGVNAVKYAKRYVEDVQYYAADACRADRAYLYRVLEAVIDAGVTVVNIPDAIGFYTPNEWGELVRDIRENVPNIDKVIVSVHCHNDLGMATANTLEAIANGARQAECAINGIGERTGNAPLEEVVMALYARRETLDVETNINSKFIYPASRVVSNMTGLQVQAHKAIVGSNAFKHTSGIYENGVLKGQREDEVIDPTDIGILEAEIVLSARSSREAVQRRLTELGYRLNAREFEQVYQRFKVVAKKKAEVEDRDLEAIVTGETSVFLTETYELLHAQVTVGTDCVPMAAVCLRGADMVERWATSSGNGPVSALYNAIDDIVRQDNELLEYAVQAMTEGLDALGKVTVRLAGYVPVSAEGETEQRVFIGRGADTDILVASTKAYLFALNRLIAAQQAVKKQDVITKEVQESVDAMHEHLGAAQSDPWGWGVIRNEGLL